MDEIRRKIDDLKKENERLRAFLRLHTVTTMSINKLLLSALDSEEREQKKQDKSFDKEGYFK
ncbi:MAG: hypothetical protein ACTSYR_05210 [Candidatus Odinarchaeia archaeon]